MQVEVSHVHAAMATLAVFVSRGGLGDCGQQSVAHALADPSNTVHVIARKASTLGKLEGRERLCPYDITHSNLKQHVFDYSADSKDAQTQVCDVLKGVDAVIACPSSREPNRERKATASMRNIVAAMQRCGVQRLVYLSSVGVWQRCHPWRPKWSLSGRSWDWEWKTQLKDARRDFRAADTIVQDSKLKFVIARPMNLGITHFVEAKGTWHVMSEHCRQRALAPDIAKADVGQFLLEQALGEPAVRHSGDVMVGWRPRGMNHNLNAAAGTAAFTAVAI